MEEIYLEYLQFSILCICFFILWYQKDSSIEYIHQEDESYRMMKNHLELSNHRSDIEPMLKKMLLKTNKTSVHTKKIIDTYEEYQYIYVFYSKHLIIYFTKKCGEEDKIFFEGVNKLEDLKNISLFQIFKNKGIMTIQKETIEEEGIFVKMEECYLEKIEKIQNLEEAFYYMKKKWYHKQCDHKYHIWIEGYSLGGLYSQLFIYQLYMKGKLKKCKIKYFNIESWFGGDKENFEEFKKIVDYKSVLTYGGILHVYNKLFQKYHHIEKMVKIEEDDNDIHIKKYMKYPFPFGILRYIFKYHLLSSFVKKD